MKNTVNLFTNSIPFILVGSIMVIAIAEFHSGQHAQTLSKQSYVEQICDQMRGLPTDINLTKCHNAQNETNLEYLCNNELNQCWVEVK